MKSLFPYIIAIFLSVILLGCKVPYNPVVISSHSNYLVIEGMINTGGIDSTIIKLSRTVTLNSKLSTQAETGAKVMIENDANATTYDLKSIKAGTYAIGSLNLIKTAKYRLRIITSNSKTYVSDFIAVKESPVMDTVSYTTPSDGLHIAVTTHDNTNNTRYYRWEYAETWIIHPPYPSNFIPSGQHMVPRNASNDIYTCWSGNQSPEIILASSAKLTKDVIYNLPIVTVPAPSEKLRIRYSILVKQYALTEDAFNFWQLVKKDTEQLGSIFDSQPSQIAGNVHNINDRSEPVFGYITAGTVQQKRLFIDHNNLPAGGTAWGTNNYYIGCLLSDDMTSVGYLKTISKNDYALLFNRTYVPLYIPSESLIQDPALDPPFVSIQRPCADCTLRGTNKKPAFWQ